jgi:hypothetical protein
MTQARHEYSARRGQESFRSMPPIPMMVPPIGTAIIPSNALECLRGE